MKQEWGSGAGVREKEKTPGKAKGFIEKGRSSLIPTPNERKYSSYTNKSSCKNTYWKANPCIKSCFTTGINPRARKVVSQKHHLAHSPSHQVRFIIESIGAVEKMWSAFAKAGICDQLEHREDWNAPYRFYSRDFFLSYGLEKLIVDIHKFLASLTGFAGSTSEIFQKQVVSRVLGLPMYQGTNYSFVNERIS